MAFWRTKDQESSVNKMLENLLSVSQVRPLNVEKLPGKQCCETGKEDMLEAQKKSTDLPAR